MGRHHRIVGTACLDQDDSGIGTVMRSTLSFWKACSCSSPHWNLANCRVSAISGSAHNEYLTLIPYFVKEDSLNMKPEVLKGLISFNPVNLKILEHFHNELPDLGKIKIPNKLNKRS